MDQIILAVDPGRDKCGIAVVHKEKGVLIQQVVHTKQLVIVAKQLMAEYNMNHVVIGDRTSSQEAKHNLEQITINDQPIRVILVDEHCSTDQARQRYWQENPPKGIMRLIPVTMQVPPKPVDDYVAVILAERYFSKEKS